MNVSEMKNMVYVLLKLLMNEYELI